MAASSTSWKIEPFTEGLPIPFQAIWTGDQFVRIKLGLVPKEMEDKWFIFYDAPHLFLHRSWTGMPIYRIRIGRSQKGYQVAEALVASKFAAGSKWSPSYDASLVDFLISNFLLGESKPFPLPSSADEAKYPGVLQHNIAGTGYAQQLPPKAKPWWRIW